jgi:hypothetical protein
VVSPLAIRKLFSDVGPHSYGISVLIKLNLNKGVRVHEMALGGITIGSVAPDPLEVPRRVMQYDLQLLPIIRYECKGPAILDNDRVPERMSFGRVHPTSPTELPASIVERLQPTSDAAGQTIFRQLSSYVSHKVSLPTTF